MRKRTILSMGLAMLALGCGDDVDNGGGTGGMGGQGGVGGASGQSVTIDFAAMVGEDEFVCGSAYTGLGSDDSELTLSDFRFYVQDVELKNADDEWVPLALAENGFQIENVALLDFENRCAGNEAGNPELNDVVVGTVPDGEYDGLRFKMGVPIGLNHEDASTAAGPLGVVAMFWTWRGGYKFLRVDSGSFSMNDWRMHLGSTACGMGDPTTPPEEPCANPNRVDVEFETFDPANNTVIADFAALVDGVPLGPDTNTPMTPVGCMSGLDDPDCEPIFENLGLAFGETPAGTQTFFSAE